MSGSFRLPTRGRAFVLAAAALLALVVYCLVALGGSTSGPDRATAQTGTTKTFMKILDQEGKLISGGATDSDHKDQIEVRGFGFGISNPSTFSAGGLSAGKANAAKLTFTHRPNPSWARLFSAAAQGLKLTQAVLSVSRTGETPALNYLTYTLEPVLVTSATDAGSSSGAPTQSVALDYGKVTVSYREQTPAGVQVTRGSWNFETNATE